MISFPSWIQLRLFRKNDHPFATLLTHFTILFKYTYRDDLFGAQTPRATLFPALPFTSVPCIR